MDEIPAELIPLRPSHLSDRWTELLLPAVVAAIGWALMYGFTVDDAYISFRYAHNAVAGHGLVFNPGERVEGFSNPIWVLMMIAGDASGIAMPMLAKVLGLIFALVTIIYTQKIARRFELDRVTRMIMLVTFAATPHLAYYSACGLETMLYVAEITAIAYYLLGGEGRQLLKISAILAVTMLTRPEAPLLLAFVAAFAWYRTRSFTHTMRIALPSILVLLGIIAFRYVYYSDILPNTYTAKLIGGRGFVGQLLFKARSFVEYTLDSFDHLAFLPVLAVIGLIQLRDRARPLLIVLIPIITFVWIANGDWMGLGRFYLPIVPLLFVLAYAAFSDMLKRSNAWQKLLVGAVPLIVVVAGVVISRHQLQNDYGFNTTMSASRLGEVGDYLERTTPPGSLIAVPEIGRIAYGNDFRVLDMQGLTDTGFARMVHTGDFSHFTNYLLSREPQIIILYDRAGPRDTAMYPLEKEVIGRMEASGNYSLDTILPLNYYKKAWIYRR